jgi:hypothetical protein
MNLKLPKPTVDLKEIRRLYHKEAAAVSAMICDTARLRNHL